MKSGIYKITNIINSKFYIGSSVDLQKRKREHFRFLNKNSHGNNLLQKQYNKYGNNNLIFEILENIDCEKLIEAEQKYLDLYYDNQKQCLNLCPTARNMLGFKFSDESKQKMSKSWSTLRKDNLIKQSIENNIYFTPENSSGDKNKFFGKRHFNETKILLSKIRINKSYEELYGKEKSQKIKDKISKNCRGVKRVQTEKLKEVFKNCNEQRKKKIFVKNTQTNQEYNFNSIREASRTLGISRTIFKDGLKNKYKKSKWIIKHV